MDKKQLKNHNGNMNPEEKKKILKHKCLFNKLLMSHFI